MSFSVRVDGRSLWSVGVWGELEYSLVADGGSDVASVRLEGLNPNFVPSAFRRGKAFTVSVGTLPVWSGQVSEFDRDEGVLHAVGLSRQASTGGGRGYLALDGSGDTTSNPHVALTQAVIRGLPWTYSGELPATPYSAAAATEALNYLTQLLDAVATEQGKRWGVDPDGAFYLRADDTTPTWTLTPGVGVMGSADDDFVTHLYGRRVTAMTGTPPAPSGWETETVGDDAAAAEFSRAEAKVDLTGLGLITEVRAQAILAGQLANAGARMGYTNALEATPLQLTTPGGTPAFLPMVQPGQVVRCFGVLDNGGGTTFGSTLDFVIDEVRLRAGENSIYIAPVGLASRSLSDVLAAPTPPKEAFAG